MFLHQSDLSEGTSANDLEGFEVIFAKTRAPQSEELCLLLSMLHPPLLLLCGGGGEGRGRGGGEGRGGEGGEGGEERGGEGEGRGRRDGMDIGNEGVCGSACRKRPGGRGQQGMWTVCDGDKELVKTQLQTDLFIWEVHLLHCVLQLLPSVGVEGGGAVNVGVVGGGALSVGVEWGGAVSMGVERGGAECMHNYT